MVSFPGKVKASVDGVISTGAGRRVFRASRRPKRDRSRVGGRGRPDFAFFGSALAAQAASFLIGGATAVAEKLSELKPPAPAAAPKAVAEAPAKAPKAEAKAEVKVEAKETKPEARAIEVLLGVNR